MSRVTAPGPGRAGWSSSLSVAEHTALHQSGFAPRGLVMGSSVYQIGRSWSPMDLNAYAYGGGLGGGWGAPGGWGGGGGQWGGRMGGGIVAGGVGGPWGRPTSFPGWTQTYSSQDLGWGGGWAGASVLGGAVGYGPAAICWERYVFEDGIEAAADLAVARLLAEARDLDAHGVIGTRLNFRYLEGMVSTVEFTAIGTAVARPGAAPLARPFTSHLSGQELLKLLGAGMVPVAVAVGAGSVTAEVAGSWSGGAREIPPFGDAIEASRRIAGERLVRHARAGGWAVLGTLASTGTESAERGRVSTAVLTGTLVRRFEADAPAALPLPIMRLSRP